MVLAADSRDKILLCYGIEKQNLNRAKEPDMHRRILRSLLPVLTMAVLVAACSDDNPAAPGGGLPEGVVPDFSIADVNPTSASYDQAVSPRDHLQKVSAWYFGHAT